MQAIQFQTNIKNGLIRLPKQHRTEISGKVSVIILAEEKPEPYDIITELINHPLEIPNFQPLTREEIYER